MCLSVALGTQHAMGMSHSIIFEVSGSKVLFNILGENPVIEHVMCVLIVSRTLFEAFLIRRRIDREMIINVFRSSCTVPAFLSNLNET